MTVAVADDVQPLSSYLAEAIASPQTALPQQAADAVRAAIADCMGVLVAGAREPAVARMRDVVLRGGGGDEARWLPDGRRCSARDAALINGVAAHILDYDDVGLDGHPTAVLLPAILAEGEALGCDFAAVLRAYVTGYETWAVLRATARVPLHGVGWHPSSVFGAVAAAASCATLHQLDAEAAGHALGLAGGASGGLMANFGTLAKPLQTARAAEAGLLAARLAANGTTGNVAMFDCDGDFSRLFAGGASMRPIEAFGRGRWAILSDPIGFKAYPLCFAAHRLVDAALDLRARGVPMEEVERVTAYLGRIPSEVLHACAPGTPLEAKFSAEFAVASALLYGPVTLEHLDPKSLDDPTLRALMQRVERQTTDAIGEEPPHAPADRIVLHLRGGATVSSVEVRDAPGSRRRPMSRDQAEAKFVGNAAPSLGEGAATMWFNRLLELKPGDPITAALSPPIVPQSVGAAA